MNAKTLTCLLACLMVPAMAHAGKEKYVTLGAGVFEIGDSQDAFEYRVEYRHSNIWRELYPTFGINGTSEGAVYGFGGLAYDFYPWQKFYLTPGFAVGAFDEGDGKDLGGTLEFRSSIELGWQFDNATRLGLNLSHISNAGIYDRNPGEESLVVNLSVPFSLFK